MRRKFIFGDGTISINVSFRLRGERYGRKFMFASIFGGFKFEELLFDCFGTLCGLGFFDLWVSGLCYKIKAFVIWFCTINLLPNVLPWFPPFFVYAAFSTLAYSTMLFGCHTVPEELHTKWWTIEPCRRGLLVNRQVNFCFVSQYCLNIVNLILDIVVCPLLHYIISLIHYLTKSHSCYIINTV